MCGIAGATRIGSSALISLAHGLSHRGPDGHDVWQQSDNEIGLAHSRLAVIDLSEGGRQPMASPCGRYTICYNGEVYNYLNLRRALEGRGEKFKTESDTEVVLRLLMRHGPQGLKELTGMFSIALWDREEKSLLLARDRFGIKPLVFGRLPKGDIAFSSEINTLAQIDGIDLSLDETALSQYLACLYVPAPKTIYRGISKLLPGCYCRWQAGVLSEPEPYWTLNFGIGEKNLSKDEAVEEIEPAIMRAVRSTLVADVPVGSFLSGGLDSSVISAMAAQLIREDRGAPLQTFTMVFDNPAYDERDLAQQIATRIKSNHCELHASPNVAQYLDASIKHFGEPFGNPTSLLIYDLSRKAREYVKVALVGDGGDEIFAGYPRYEGGLLAGTIERYVPRTIGAHLIAPLADLLPEGGPGRHRLRRAREFLAAIGNPVGDSYAQWVEYFSSIERAGLLGGTEENHGSVVGKLFATHKHYGALNAMQRTDLQSFLPGNLLAYGDAMSMAHGLELRLPMLDHHLVDVVGSTPWRYRMDGGKKALLRAVAEKWVPKQVLNAPKKGFNPPIGQWLKGQLSSLLRERLPKDFMMDVGLDSARVMSLVKEHESGFRDHGVKLWGMLSLEAWHRAKKSLVSTQFVH